MKTHSFYIIATYGNRFWFLKRQQFDPNNFFFSPDMKGAREYEHCNCAEEDLDEAKEAAKEGFGLLGKDVHIFVGKVVKTTFEVLDAQTEDERFYISDL